MLFPYSSSALDSAPGTLLSVPGSIGGAAFIVPSFLFSDNPRASAYNPAAEADRELPAFGAAASLAFPTGQGSGAGAYASVSAAFPTLLGNAYALADGVFSQSSLNGFAAPLGASGLVGLAKAASDNFSLGASFGAAVLSSDSVASGFFGALGAQVRFPKLASGGTGFSFALLGVGSRPQPWASFSPTVSWTPLVAASSRLIDGRSFSLTASALIASPSFSDLVVSAGSSFGLGGVVAVDLGWLFSLSETVRYARGEASALASPRFFPSIALRFDSSSLLRLSSYGASLGASFRPVSGGAGAAEVSAVFSRGTRDIDGPSIAVGPASSSVYSPLLVDSFTVPLAVRDASPITAWEAVVYDEGGNVYFRRGESKTGKEEADSFVRFFSLNKGVRPPAALSVPLRKTAKGGSYSLRVWAKDTRGNEARSPEYRFILDADAPSAEISIAGSSVFTPNGDGVRDSLSIRQSGSVEREWLGTFADAAGKIVRSYRWSDSAPLPFAWDGNDESAQRVGDGEYSYTLAAVDAAGNAFSSVLRTIVVDSELTPLSLTLNATALSPGRDGAFDSVRLAVNAPVKRGLIDWAIDIISVDTASDKVLPFRSWKGASERLDVLPQNLIFDGRNADGDAIPDGRYRFRALLRYANGNAPEAVSQQLTVDTRPPEGRVRCSSSILTIGAGLSQIFFHDLSRNAQWRGVVTDESGSTVRTLAIPRGGESSVEWNGLGDDGTPVPDGLYRYAAEGKSATGIDGKTGAVSFRVESGGASVSLLADRKLFSPVLARSLVRFLPRLAKRERVVSYSMEVVDAARGSIVRNFAGIAVPPSSLVWDGLDENGKVCRDGSYRVTLTVKYESGQEAKSEPLPLLLDGTQPSSNLSIAAKLFSPNGDGRLDSVEIAQSASPESSWFAEIVDAQGRAVFSREFSGELPSVFSWDGKTDRGDLAANGSYRYRLSAVDAAGNEGKAESAPFVLDARVPSAVLSADKFAFSPNGDGFADVVRFRAVSAFADGLSSVAFRILDQSGAEVFRIGGSSLKGEYLWDGKTAEGKKARDGKYKATIDLSYEKGDRISAESSLVLLDSTPPVLRADLSPLPFSPDGDGENDLLTIKLSAEDQSSLAGWSFSVLDPEGLPFASFSGKNPQPIEWDGTDPEGNLVEAAQDYSYVYTVRDQLGNTARLEGKIPVDVFVLRDGDRLKIRVSSITFAPNAAALESADQLVSEKNVKVLDRIAAVLGKFPDYRVRVEGHAVNLSGTEREERTELEPLSLARAKVVMDALIQRGIAADRLASRGLGGREPVVPHGDAASRWKNRRVEFILVR